jgi:hypothetical protein
MRIYIVRILLFVFALLLGWMLNAEAAKLVSCISVPAATGCTVSLVSMNGVTPTTIWSDEAMTEIADPGSGGLSNYVKAYSSDLDSTLDYFVYCNCGDYDWSYVWDVTETRQDVKVSSRLAPTDTIEGSYTFQQLLRLMSASLFGKASGGGTTIITFRSLGDTKNRIQATVDSKGNRTAVILDGD